jgi:hypothetical protein
MPHRRPLWLLLPIALLLTAASPPPGAARFTSDGRLIPPVDYREWIFVTAGLDMNYAEGPPMDGASMFDNVFVDPAAWRVFKQTGRWPDGTMLVKEARGASGKGSINRHGQFQAGDVMDMEVHVRDSARFKGGWGFFALDGATPAPMIPYEASCYACHQAHAAVDTTFVQFYPTAKPIAVKAGTYQDR